MIFNNVHAVKVYCTLYIQQRNTNVSLPQMKYNISSTQKSLNDVIETKAGDWLKYN